MFESRISAGATEKLAGWENLTQTRLCGLTIWMDMLKKCVERCCEHARPKRQSSFTKFQVLAWMITISRKKTLNPWENCQKCAHKLS